MAKTKHRADAAEQIDAYINGLPDWSKKVCTRLREIVLKSDPKIIEDWKWGPNYYREGMVCGFAAFQKHVNFVFFKGTLLKDKKKLLAGDTGNVTTRHIRFKEVKEINQDILLEYLFEAIENNVKGIKPKAADKIVLVPADVKKAFKKAGVLAYFETCNYSHRKEWVRWIEDAKKQETRNSRILRATEKLLSKAGIIKRNK